MALLSLTYARAGSYFHRIDLQSGRGPVIAICFGFCSLNQVERDPEMIYQIWLVIKAQASCNNELNCNRRQILKAYTIRPLIIFILRPKSDCILMYHGVISRGNHRIL